MARIFDELRLRSGKSFVTVVDLSLLCGTDAGRYGVVNRALKNGALVRIRRGLYVLTKRGSSAEAQVLPNLFELAQMVYGPSYVSFEAALSFHQLIPEGILTITSASARRSCEFRTPLGLFSYHKVPVSHFLLGVERRSEASGDFLMATPWRAIADLIYVRKKHWSSSDDLCGDLRIEESELQATDRTVLQELLLSYPNQRTRDVLMTLRNTL